MLEALAAWLLNYLLHSSLLLGGAALAERHPALQRSLNARELLWRIALFGGLLSATAQALAPPLLDAWRQLPQQASSLPAEPRSAGLVLAAVEPLERAAEGRLAPAPVAELAAPVRIRQDLALSARVSNAVGILTLAWVLVALGGLVLLGLRLAALRWQVRRLRLAAEPAWQQAAQRLAGLAGLPTPSLRLSENWQSPLVTPDGAICLPRWLAAKLDERQCEAVLAHEIAHLLRRDPAWRLAGQWVAALGWLQPLNQLALRRLDALAELACDRWAAQASGQPVALAESLYACAEQIVRRGRAPHLAAAMARPDSALLQRIRSLMEDTPMQEGQAGLVAKRFKWRWLALAAVLSALFGAVAVPAVVLGKMDSDWVMELQDGFSFHRGTRIVSNDGQGSTRVSVRGSDLRFNEAEDEIIGVTGSVKISEKRGGLRREAFIESQPGGALKTSYSVDGKVQEFDAAGREWLKTMVRQLADTMVSADERVRKLFAKGGLEAVLTDLDKPRSDFDRRARIEALVGLREVGALTPAALDRVIAAVGAMGSDYDRRAAFVALLENQKLPATQQVALLDGTARIGSDFDRRTVLEALVPQQLEEGAVLQAWVKVMRSMGSDFDRRTAIEQLMDRKPLGKPTLDAALQVSTLLGSDFDRRTALQRIAPRLDLSTQVEAYVQSASRMGSDFDQREALVTLIERGPLDKAATLLILDGTRNLGSDFELANVLKALAEQMPADAELLSRYRKVARRLSDHERGQVEKALDRLDRS
ncbi:M56 family metallopeptidase [Pelomonas sp. V22]|uniref:M56 family metallopeptidase n=1 Tax=Pelomonas sp. V22 TaxID=2822139 RepID=UPI0024A9393E|nr:M56 family metallopeptidase [Pelomonas sp. V22]MDI4635047.1 M56 family metallopeptidase [Pelomonas sp. V22]